MKYLIDTCLLSELTKPKPSAAVVEWLEAQDENDLYISVLTLGEIHKGVGKLANGRKKRRLQAWVEHDLRDRFAGRVLTIDHEIAETWGGIAAAAESQGTRLPVIDGLLSATALSKGLTIATRNTKDMDASGARTLNPWR